MKKTILIILAVIGGLAAVIGACGYACVTCFRDSAENRQVVIEDLTAGTVTPVGGVGISLEPRFSRDGARLYYLTRGTAKQQTARTLVTHSLAENRTTGRLVRPDARLSSFVAPDGRVLALSDDGNNDLCIVARDGSSLQRLTSAKKDRKDAQLSPDGSMVAYLEEDASSYHNIYVMPAGGGTAVRLTNVDGLLSSIQKMAWTADSRHIAYISLMNLVIKDLTGVVVDTISLAGLNNVKAILADGAHPDRLLVVAREADGGLSFGIYAVSRKTKKYQLWKENRSFWEMDHSLSPDGTRLAYTATGESKQ